MNNTNPESPFVKYEGHLSLGNKDIDCYVLDTGDRVISSRATVKAISGDSNGDLSKYVGVRALQPYINESKLNKSIIEFSIPGNPQGGARNNRRNIPRYMLSLRRSSCQQR